MIASIAEIKQILNITTTDHDEFIKFNMKFVEEEICRYCNNDFINKDYDYEMSNAVSFIAIDNSVNLEGLGNSFLEVGDSFRILGSKRNDGVHVVYSKTADKIIVDTLTTIIDEAKGSVVYVARIAYPHQLKFVLANMVSFNIDRASTIKAGIKSEKLDDYSITYESFSANYPASLVAALNGYRMLYTKDVFKGCV